MKAARLFAVTFAVCVSMLSAPAWAEGEAPDHSDQPSSETSRPTQESAEAKELIKKINACMNDRAKITESLGSAAGALGSLGGSR